MKQLEHNLQVACVRWFDAQYSDISRLLFAIPNGGKRNKITAVKLKAEGVRAGVADLFLAVTNEQYAGLFIEMKVGKNKRTPAQAEFKEMVRMRGYACVVCYSLDEFINAINHYLSK
jgi:hypothetical protein